MSAAQYSGRVFDVLAFRGAMLRGSVQLSQSLFDSSTGGEICTGRQKMAQRWALEFLTPRGTMGFHLSDRGTDFMTLARAGRLRSEVDVQVEYNFAAVLVRQHMLADEDTDMPADERFQADELLQIVISPGLLQLSVQLTSQAGDAGEIILPINITPANLTL